MKKLFSSLHFRLLLIVLFSLVPSFGLILYSTIELRVQAEREIQENVTQIDHSVALEEDELLGGARQFTSLTWGKPKASNVRQGLFRCSFSKLDALPSALCKHRRY